MPFKYGIAVLTAVPHILVRVNAVINGVHQSGLAAEGLPPKWFTKNPDTSFEDDLQDMFGVIRSACGHAIDAGEAQSPYHLWRETMLRQAETQSAHPPLLWGFGVSLVERALLDAFCRANNTTISHAVHQNLLGVELGDIHPELKGSTPGDWLPEAPLQSVIARHTVGLADPLDVSDIPDGEKIDDGLPQSLQDCINRYGLSHFKIKVCGDPAIDAPRLHQIARLLQQTTDGRFEFTLDGNEQFHDVAAFRAFWEAITSDSTLTDFLERMIFVEQPIHRDSALTETTQADWVNWPDAPPTIIDEADGSIDSLRNALQTGYVGTSHKNCKGVMKGIANACYIACRNQNSIGKRYILSGEDLANVGPIALLQDLAIMSLLGVEHVERNGHHYFSGLGMWPLSVQNSVLSKHNDLYEPSRDGFPTLRIQSGRINLNSVRSSPFGFDIEIDPSLFTPLNEWSFDMLYS
ncbi:MAG: hypothetical protein GC154_02280 [bacterium]|nr:hypothetical protein [bacterium]